MYVSLLFFIWMLRQYTGSFYHDKDYYTYPLHSLPLVVTSTKSLLKKFPDFHFANYFPFWNKVVNDNHKYMIKSVWECTSPNQRYLLLSYSSF